MIVLLKKRKQARQLSFLLGSLLVLCVGCANPLDGYEAPAPRILDLKFLGTAEKDNRVLIFEMAFEDDEGDLGDGQFVVHVNQQKIGPEPLLPLFQRSGVHPNSSAGVLRFEVVVDVSKNGNRHFQIPFTVRVEVEDGLQLGSNTQAINLILSS